LACPWFEDRQGSQRTIEVDNRPAHGTVFSVYVLVIRRASVGPKPEALCLTGTERMLVANDEVAIVETVRKRSNAWGYEIDTITSRMEVLG